MPRLLVVHHSPSSSVRALADAVTGAEIHRDERKGEQPSDHVPVVAEFNLGTGAADDLPMIFA